MNVEKLDGVIPCEIKTSSFTRTRLRLGGRGSDIPRVFVALRKVSSAKRRPYRKLIDSDFCLFGQSRRLDRRFFTTFKNLRFPGFAAPAPRGFTSAKLCGPPLIKQLFPAPAV
jgi:hypothetical protein